MAPSIAERRPGLHDLLGNAQVPRAVRRVGAVPALKPRILHQGSIGPGILQMESLRPDVTQVLTPLLQGETA